MHAGSTPCASSCRQLPLCLLYSAALRVARVSESHWSYLIFPSFTSDYFVHTALIDRDDPLYTAIRADWPPISVLETSNLGDPFADQ